MRPSSSTSELDPGFTTPALSACFSAVARVGRMLDVEAALARAAADCGLVSTGVAEEIAGACASLDVDASAVLAEGWEVGTPVVALLGPLRAALSSDAAEVVGFGATTQDIVDTAAQLQMRDALDAIDVDLARVAVASRELAAEHRATPMIGRTFLQHAEPTTFGLVAARWLDAVATHRAELADIQGAVQLGGPVGTLDAPELSAALATRLGLADPVGPWHGDRTRVSAAVSAVGRVARTMAKIGADVAVLASSDIAEIRVRSGGSSTMAGKRNPIDAVRAVAAADACAGAVATVLAARPIELERGIGGWHVEWFAVPVACMTAAASVEAIARCIESLEVDASTMARRAGDADVAAAVRLADRLLAR